MGPVCGSKVVKCVPRGGTSYSLVQRRLLYDVLFSHHAQHHSITVLAVRSAKNCKQSIECYISDRYKAAKRTKV